jgi:membrane associated rhomboid family serine protease
MVSGKGGFSAKSIHSWVTLFTHILGHANWAHLGNNFIIILLIGPILEETYGTYPLLIMIAITALVTGALNVLFFSSALLGASGVVFMMILLASFTNFNKGEIPLTFIVVLGLQLVNEIFASLAKGAENNISQFAHIVGGFIGSLFGFLRVKRAR